MGEVQELEARIRVLPREGLAELRAWFYQFENEVWDQQIQADFKAGKFDNLINEARRELVQGKAREL
jgi:hypothetical protein